MQLLGPVSASKIRAGLQVAVRWAATYIPSPPHFTCLRSTLPRPHRPAAHIYVRAKSGLTIMHLRRLLQCFQEGQIRFNFNGGIETIRGHHQRSLAAALVLDSIRGDCNALRRRVMDRGARKTMSLLSSTSPRQTRRYSRRQLDTVAQ